MARWTPPTTTTRKEQLLLKRLTRTKKLFAFLRMHRHELFDEAFQAELETMYRGTGAGREPMPPAILCMISLLQAYTGTSDAEAVELTVVDARWQMVLDCMNAETPLVSQSTLPAFRSRLIQAGLDRRLLERTVELAKQTKEFDWKKLPKELRVAVDSLSRGHGDVAGHHAERLVRRHGRAGGIDQLQLQLDLLVPRAGSGQERTRICRRQLPRRGDSGLGCRHSEPRGVGGDCR